MLIKCINSNPLLSGISIAHYYCHSVKLFIYIMMEAVETLKSGGPIAVNLRQEANVNTLGPDEFINGFFLVNQRPGITRIYF